MPDAGYGAATEHSARVGELLRRLEGTLPRETLQDLRRSATLTDRDRWRRALKGQRLSNVGIKRIVAYLTDMPKYQPIANDIADAWALHGDAIRASRRKSTVLVRLGTTPLDTHSRISQHLQPLVGSWTAAVARYATSAWHTSGAEIIASESGEATYRLRDAPGVSPGEGLFGWCDAQLSARLLKGSRPTYDLRLDARDGSGFGRGIVWDVGDALKGSLVVAATESTHSEIYTMVLVRADIPPDHYLQTPGIGSPGMGPRVVHHLDGLLKNASELTPYLIPKSPERWFPE